MEKNKRIINVRPLFLIFIAFGAGVVCIYNFLFAASRKRFDFSMVLLAVLLLAFFVFTVLYFLEKHKRVKPTNFHKHLKNNYKYLLIFVLALLLGASAGYFQTRSFYSLKKYRNEECSIVGKIVELDSGKIVLKNVFVKEYNDKLRSGCVVYFNEDEELQLKLGDRVEIAGMLSLQSLYSNHVNISRFLSSNAYQFNMESGGLVAITSGKITFAENVRQSVFNILSKTLNSENTSVSMSILFGVRQDFPHEVSEAFSLVGISHLLAVSGMHVGILLTVLLFVLNALSKRKTWWHFLIIAFIAIFYCYLCDFTFSAIRATIMGLVLLAANVSGRRYDSLSALSLAGILILLIAPLAIFSVGFQLSFLCVFAIITLAPTITKFFKNLKLPRKLSSALAISISVNAVLFPLSANIFNKVSIISVFANIIIIPIFLFVYISLLLFLIVSMILPFLSFLLILPNAFLHIIKLIASTLSKMPYAYINIFHVGYFIVILTIILAFIIKYLMVENSTKYLFSGVLIFIIIFISIFANFPASTINNKVFIDYQLSGNYAFVINEKSEVSLVGFNKNTYYINQSMIRHRIKNIKNIIAYDFDLSMLPSLVQFTLENKVEYIYLPSNFESSLELFENLSNRTSTKFLKNESVIDGFIVQQYNDINNNPLAINIEISNKQLLFIKKLNSAEFVYLANSLEGAPNYAIANSINRDFSNYLPQFEYVIYHNINNTIAKDYIDLYSLYTFTLQL